MNKVLQEQGSTPVPIIDTSLPNGQSPVWRINQSSTGFSGSSDRAQQQSDDHSLPCVPSDCRGTVPSGVK